MPGVSPGVLMQINGVQFAYTDRFGLYSLNKYSKVFLCALCFQDLLYSQPSALRLGISGAGRYRGNIDCWVHVAN